VGSVVRKVLILLHLLKAVGSGGDCWGTALQNGSSRVGFPMKSQDLSLI